MGGGSSMKIWEAVDMGDGSSMKIWEAVDMGGGSSVNIWEVVRYLKKKRVGKMTNYQY